MSRGLSSSISPGWSPASSESVVEVVVPEGADVPVARLGVPEFCVVELDGLVVDGFSSPCRRLRARRRSSLRARRTGRLRSLPRPHPLSPKRRLQRLPRGPRPRGRRGPTTRRPRPGDRAPRAWPRKHCRAPETSCRRSRGRAVESPARRARLWDSRGRDGLPDIAIASSTCTGVSRAGGRPSARARGRAPDGRDRARSRPSSGAGRCDREIRR